MKFLNLYIFKRRILKNKGFTLVEMLAAMAVFVLLMAAMATLFTPVSRVIYNTRKDVRIDSVMDNSSDYIRRVVDVSSKVGIYEGTDPLGTLTADLPNFLTDRNFSPDAPQLDLDLPPQEQVFALYIAPNGRLFDLGNVNTITNHGGLMALVGPNTQVFFDAYYGRCQNMVFEISRDAASGVVNVNTDALDPGGERLTRPRNSNFQFLKADAIIDPDDVKPATNIPDTPAPISSDSTGLFIIYTRYV